MKVAYLIQSHTGVRQVARLAGAVRALDPESWIHVSHDERGAEGIEEAVAAVPGVHVTRDAGGRGTFHMVRRWLRAVDALRDDGGADFVVVLSGQDYPVRPLRHMHDDLAASGDGFVETFPALTGEGSPWPVREGRSRYLYRWRPLLPLSDRARDRLHLLHGVNRVQPWLRVNVAYGHLKLGVRHGGIPQGLQCRGGSMFTSLSWRAVEHVARTVAERPDVVAWGEGSLCTDEAFFQTVLTGMPDLRVEPSARRYFRFDGARFGHPKVLTTEDVDDALASGDYFARKFDERTDCAALDLIDEALGLR